MTNRHHVVAATAVFSTLFAVNAAALERQIGPVKATVELGAGVQAASFEDPRTGRSDDDSDFVWSASLNLESITSGGAVYGLHLEIDDGGRAVEDLARDELYIYYATEIGRFELGEQDGAADVLSLRAPLVGLGQIRGEFSRYAGAAALVSPFDTSDAFKLNYISAPFGGLRFGASYAPKFERNEDDPNPRARTVQRDGIELGLQYQVPVGDWALGASGAWVTASSDPITQRADIDSWSVGVQARRDRLVLGGAYVSRGDSDRLAATDQTELNMGVAWRAESWGVGLSAAFGESRAVDQRLLGVGAYYEFAKYFVVRGDVVHVDEDRPGLPGADGVVLVMELGAQF